MKKPFLLIILLASTVYTHSQSTNSTGNLALTGKGQTVWNRVIDLHNAVFGNKDSIVISKLVSDAVHYGHSTGLLENKATMVHNASTNSTVYENVSNQLTSVSVFNDVAIVRLVLKGTSTDKGNASPLHLGIIQVWHKEKGAWRLVERQAVKLLK